jgi:hypothetical protein
MKLICFPHYTCGGLLCDIFEQKFSSVRIDGGLRSFGHSIGKIGDSIDVYDDYDPAVFYKKISEVDSNYSGCIGTHCHPGKIDLDQFNDVVLITTSTYRSKVYRWIRAYHHYFSVTEEWKKLQGIDRIDKQRETAKNYIKPFNPVKHKNVTNIEFSDIVENSENFQFLINKFDYAAHLDRWRQLNDFLYDTNLWWSAPVQRFHEAEFENNLNFSYRYE